MGENNKTSNYKKYIPETEEIRDGFKVSINRKKVWNVELGLLEELKKICKKHNLKYYASGGTMLGAIRHKGYIPRDDDMDLLMFREDYEKLIKIAPKELPKNIEFCEYYLGFSKIENKNTSALSADNLRDNDFTGGIRIDIFPIDYASKFTIINWIKSVILLFLRAILISKKSYSIDYLVKRKRKKFFVYPCKLIFNKLNSGKVYQLHEKISKTIFFKGKNIYSGWCPNQYYPKEIFNKSFDIEFENTTIPIPEGYDAYLKTTYGNYLKPVIRENGHHCWYSVDKSFKEIIKKFDKSKTNEENYKNCKDLFLL